MSDRPSVVSRITPAVVLVFSGKRKSGKDFITEIIQKRLGFEVCSIMRLSGPLKSQYAKEHRLDADRLLDATSYKEHYRADMIKWGEERRQKDPSYFCRLATEGMSALKPVWIISDARRKTDIEYFNSFYKEQTLLIRVQAKESVRMDRGWKFTSGVDDAESECDLDSGITWHMIIDNNGQEEQLNIHLQTLIDKINNKLQSQDS
ncbi:phosphomevalonate kinase [Lingula anatina]|uniref:Phosphomevalonate kinase n=1 Tax=Lingula anatina TaxID=7574 RepID=A0A1S3K6T8_LINAN|nr:phosphomevalonate kinase [Lingula anatina]|eukprot:XP_013418217.1 phosphomevalonate kinase [Lingula anatina]